MVAARMKTGTSASAYADCDTQTERRPTALFLLRVGSPDPGRPSSTWPRYVNARPRPTPRDPNVERCDVELKVRMARAGVLDSAFRNGGISFGMKRSVTIEYTPLR